MKNEIKLIDVNLILEAEGNPRAEFNEVFLDGLAQSIARQGLINPITVAEANGGCYEVVCGAQRLRAFALARERYGLEQKEIPCIVVEGKESQLSEIRIVENLQRAQLTSAEEAAGVIALMRLTDINGMPVYPTKADVAAALGVSVSWVRDRLAIAEMNETLDKKIEDLPVSIGREIARLPADRRKDVLEAYFKSNEETDEEKLEDALQTECRDLEDASFYFNETLAGRSSCENCPYFVRGRYCMHEDSDCMDDKDNAVMEDCKTRLEAEISASVKREFPNAKVVESWEWACGLTISILDAARLFCRIPVGNPPKGKKAPVLWDVIPEDYSGEICYRLTSCDAVYEEKDGKLQERPHSEIGEYRGLTYELRLGVEAARKILLNSPQAAQWLVLPNSKEEELEKKKEKILKECQEKRNTEMRRLRVDDVLNLNFADTPETRRLFARLTYEYYNLRVGNELARIFEVDAPKDASCEEWEKFLCENFQDRDILAVLKVALIPYFWCGMYGDSWKEPTLPQGMRTIDELREETESGFKYLQEYKLKELEKTE